MPSRSAIRARIENHGAHHLFDVDDALIVTNPFHLHRAVFLARQIGIDADGVRAVPTLDRLHPADARGPAGDIYSLERVPGGPHAVIMRTRLNRERPREDSEAAPSNLPK